MKDYNAVDELQDSEEAETLVQLNIEKLTKEEQSQILSKCVFVGCNTKVYCCLVDSDGVKLVWKDKIANNSVTYRYPVCTHLSVSRNQLYVATKNCVTCYEPLTGKIVWSVRPDFHNGMLTYKLLNTLVITRGDDVITGDSSLLLCAANSVLVALEPDTGRTVHRIKFGKFIAEPATVMIEHNGAIIIGCSGRVKAFNISTGELLWKNKLKGFGDQPVSLSSYFYNNVNCIIVGTSGYTIVLDGQTGNKIKDVNLKGLYPVSL